ncbi:diaminopimelate decarboxylase [Thiosocius teredinicola]|uniref:diaminopimelate decarboxylase n=1 Tax=Thiosocius teredinicola TaxID=1973002 RepID=UPI00099112BF
MDHFQYRDGELFAEDVPLRAIAEQHGTPCYVYSRATLERHWRAFDNAFGTHPHLVCYAVKANSNLAVLNVLARLGSGFDIVSVGELERVLAAGGDPSKVLFSGVGKQEHEMRRALEVGIRCFNVESAAELERLDRVAGEMGTRAPIALRVNPDVDAETHPYISTGLKENKFGVSVEDALGLYRRAAQMANIEVSGVDCHIGSQLTRIDPFLDALDRVMALVERLAGEGIAIDHLDLGGGLGVRYDQEKPPEPDAYARALLDRMGDARYEIFIEPGRAIAANAGVLLTRVEYLKRNEGKDFAVIDAAMNDLIRPSLYQAWQQIVTVEQAPQGTPASYDLVGPICETGDFLGKQRPLTLQQGTLLAVRSAGAYGFTMASNYNTRPRVPEIMVDGEQMFVVRRRETVSELYAGESTLPT